MSSTLSRATSCVLCAAWRAGSACVSRCSSPRVYEMRRIRHPPGSCRLPCFSAVLSSTFRAACSLRVQLSCNQTSRFFLGLAVSLTCLVSSSTGLMIWAVTVFCWASSVSGSSSWSVSPWSARLDSTPF
ncbi:hypothetical protein FA95DRAFT_83691 [Auriscalpium vulgare]|uniref:Uncharacterized protein n=1 Tax=Auriscalpium vulgare TaxID=40419 RepID=A0ACB8RP97_9AGAM|nr:hypothetical protein FA95DRAFT_83691 [Auriscalpium vulgare]